MKKVLITGAGSYIGTRVENWLLSKKEGIEITTFDTMEEGFLEKSFVGFDTVFHVAGIAHVSADPSKEDMYYKINRDLAIDTAKKAKAEGVGQFVFMSSIIVYGNEGQKGIIDKNTKENPADFYGRSKLMAEEGLKPLEDNHFKVAIVRPPMIYGKDSKGNYPRLSKMARKLPFFPMVENQRSMLHIDNLCELIYLIIKSNEGGTFYPQNAEYVNTSRLVKEIATCHDKPMLLVKGFGWLIKPMRKKIGILRKVFGNMAYDKEMSKHFENAYCVVDFEESIRRTEA